MILLISQNAFADITSNLSGWWKLDEVSGDSALDSSGNSNTGTEYVSNVATNGTYVVGEIGTGAIFLNGSTQYISIPNSTSLEPTTALTLAAWIKTSTSGAYQQIITKDHANGTAGRSWQFRINTSNELEFITFTTNGIFTCDSSGTVTDGKWHHAAAVYNGTNMQLYIDGSANGSSCSQSGPIGVGYGVLTNNTLIGSDANIGSSDCPGGTCPDFQFSGAIDDARVYLRALSSSDIAQLYSYTDTSTTTNYFQNGVSPTSGYSGENDNMLNAASNTTNYNGSNITIGQFSTGGGSSKEGILKFDLSSISSGSTCNSATLEIDQLTGDNTTAVVMSAYNILRPTWSPSQSTWTIYSTGNNWTTAGALGNGTDYSNSSFSVTNSFTNNALGFQSFPTSSSFCTAIQSSFGSTFNVIILESSNKFPVNTYAQYNYSTAADRPILIVNYTASSGASNHSGFDFGF